MARRSAQAISSARIRSADLHSMASRICFRRVSRASAVSSGDNDTGGNIIPRVAADTSVADDADDIEEPLWAATKDSGAECDGAFSLLVVGAMSVLVDGAGNDVKSVVMATSSSGRQEGPCIQDGLPFVFGLADRGPCCGCVPCGCCCWCFGSSSCPSCCLCWSTFRTSDKSEFAVVAFDDEGLDGGRQEGPCVHAGLFLPFADISVVF